MFLLFLSVAQKYRYKVAIAQKYRCKVAIAQKCRCKVAIADIDVLLLNILHVQSIKIKRDIPSSTFFKSPTSTTLSFHFIIITKYIYFTQNFVFQICHYLIVNRGSCCNSFSDILANNGINFCSLNTNDTDNVLQSIA